MQSIIIPEKCLGCSSARLGIQEGRAHYRCGSTLQVVRGRVRVKRSLSCLSAASVIDAAQGSKQGSEQKIQAGQGDSDATGVQA